MSGRWRFRSASSSSFCGGGSSISLLTTRSALRATVKVVYEGYLPGFNVCKYLEPVCTYGNDIRPPLYAEISDCSGRHCCVSVVYPLLQTVCQAPFGSLMNHGSWTAIMSAIRRPAVTSSASWTVSLFWELW